MLDRTTLPPGGDEHTFRSLAQLAPVGLFQTDAAGNCTYVNQRWCEIAGIDAREALGEGWSRALHPDDRQRIVSEWSQATEAGHEYSGEFRFLGSDGRTTWVHGTAITVRNEAGQVSGYLGTTTDISKRIAAENALQAKEAQLRLVTDHVPVFIGNWDRERRFTFVNRSYAARLGLKPEDIVGRSIGEVLGEEAYASFAGYIDRVLAGETLEFEVEVPYASIGRRRIHFSYVPQHDLAGEVIGWVGALSDVTERRAAEAALGEAQQRFSRFMEHVPGLAWIKDEQGRYVFANNAALTAFQTTREELYGHQDTEVFTAEVASAFRRNDARAVSSENGWLQVVETLPQADGRLHHSLVHKFAIRAQDRGGPMVGGIAIDISDRLNMEQQLRLSEQRLNLAQIAGRVGTFDWNVRTNQVEWSATEEELFGIPIGSFGGTLADWEKMVHPDDLPAALAACERAVRSESDLNIEFRILRPDGAVRWIVAQAQLLLDEQGQALRMIGVNFDITERKETEAALRDADRRKDDFLATLAHELRNPLAPLHSALHLLRITQEDETSAPLHEMMERQIKHMVRLIDDLLEISRITRGKITLRKARADLASIVRDAIDTSRPLIEEAGHRLQIDLGSAPLIVDVDVVRIAQVIANLLNNAARYTDAGGVITIAATEREGFAVVSVRDNGIGIDSEMLARIFEMFAQADHDHKRAQGGLGIGLALAKALMEMHGGRIEAHSQGLGQGSEFKIWLPLARGAAEPRPGAEKVRPASSRRILVVDDNHDAATGLSLLLEQVGNEVRTATNGPAALELLDTFHPAFVILDLGMPGMSGYEVAARIRQRTGAADIRLVALTGWAQEEDRRRTAEAGFHYHLVKPVDLDALFGVLADELPCQAPAAG